MGKTYEVLEKQDREKKSTMAEKLRTETKAPPEPRTSFSREISPQLHEANLQLKKKILSAADREIKSIVFSSAKHGEGVSTICASFALSLSKEGDSRILIIDANLRNPVLHRVFGVQNGKGLAELLVDDIDVRSVIQKTRFRNLLLMPAGKCTQNPAYKFENARLKKIIHELKGEFDFVILDSAPILLYSDTSVLAPKLDGVILIVRAEETRWEVAHKAREDLEKSGAHILGVVLNERQYHIPGFIYKRL
jgi:capsular exopolysaccharide synthesis family protein